MAHNLMIRNAQAAMFYVEEVPWHKLGKQLNKPATAAEAIQAAGLDWEVRKVPLFACEGLNNCRVPRRYATVPSFAWGEQKCPVFGIVSENYQPLQNREAFTFFDPIVGDKAAVYHTAGALGEGERVWILAKLPDSIRVAGDDITDKYLLFSNSHDGESAVQIKFTPIRVVCQNTLTMALERGPALRIAHHSDMEQRLKQAASLLGIIKTKYGRIEDSFKAMTKVQLKQDRLTEYLNLVFPDPDPAKVTAARYERALRQMREHRRWSTHFFDQGAGNQMNLVKGTLWAAYNGVTEMVDHRDNKMTPERRLQYVWFGGGYTIKARAFNVALERIAGWKN